MGKILSKRLKQANFESVEQEAVLNILVASNHIRSKVETECSKFGISLSQFNVLRILNGKYPEGYPRGDIISRMIEPAPDVWDRTYCVDFYIQVNDKYIGLQVKPISSGLALDHYQWDRMHEKNHKRFPHK